jgi:hypothetical protein
MCLLPQQTIDIWRSLWFIRKISTTGVGDVGEFVKVSDITWEKSTGSFRDEVSRRQALIR